MARSCVTNGGGVLSKQVDFVVVGLALGLGHAALRGVVGPISGGAVYGI